MSAGALLVTLLPPYRWCVDAVSTILYNARIPQALSFSKYTCQMRALLEMKMRPSREDIIKQFQACAQSLGKTPGSKLFHKTTDVKVRDVYYYWSKFSDLVRAAGYTPNEMSQVIPEDELLGALARACLHLNKFPTNIEYRIVARELHLPSDTLFTIRYGRTSDVKARFKQWLEDGSPEYKQVLDLPGWETSRPSRLSRKVAQPANKIDSSSRPFLPVCLQYLDVLSCGTKPFEDFAENVNTAFEKRCADAFVCLGFEVQELGQGRGRKADCLALAREDGFGVIIDAKVRSNGYTLGTEDRKFLEYTLTHSRELQRSGIPKIYFAVVGSEFREDDLKKLTANLAQSPIRSVVFITAKALMRMVEQSIRERHKFRLADIDKQLFGNKIIAD